MVEDRAHELPNLQTVLFCFGRMLLRNAHRLAVAMPRIEARRQIDGGREADQADQRQATTELATIPIGSQDHQRRHEDEKASEERVVRIVQSDQHAADYQRRSACTLHVIETPRGYQ